ncbi:MAG: hypothetical protein K2Y39_07245 [Candidatus Obscuribacterales bacterium]|nr:hypothetical protein [Candidatus Obscuribacterales bacterium]
MESSAEQKSTSPNAFVKSSLLLLGLLCFIVCVHRVCAAPAKRAEAVGTSKPAVAAKFYEGIVAHQTTGWGLFDTKVCHAGIRIESQTGAILIAQPPDWTVYVFRKNQKKAAKMSYELFRTKNRYAVKLSQIREKPRTVKIAGVNALMYSFVIDKSLDELTTLGSFFRSNQKQQIVHRKEVSFAPSSDLVPKQAKEIWRSYFESPVIEEIPLSTTLYFANGEKRLNMSTNSYKRSTMTAADFTVPPGLSYTAQFIEMIYGKEMEGVADLLWE